MALSANQIAGAAIAGGFSGGDVATAVAIVFAESSGDPNATNHNTNGTVDHGLWQINDVNSGALALGNWQDPVTNAKMAVMIKKEQGWRAWSTYNSGAYLKYMPQGTAGALAPSQDYGTAAAATGDTAAAAGDTATASDTLGLGPLMAASTWLRIAAVLGGAVLVFVAVAMLSGAAGTALDVGNIAAKVSALA